MSSCASVYEKQRKEYDTLASSVSAASYAVIGEYGDTIPPDLDADQFMKVIENKIPSEYFKQLKRYSLDLKPKGTYYLLLVIDQDSKSIVLFDYSCTPEVDGLILLEPNKYDLNNIDSYDPCKTLHNFENGIAIYAVSNCLFLVENLYT